ncbi:MAG TPA: hypothetical protein P5105_04390 [Victivallales bacterium]|nr:hypothetical protein [Victivallales bacterium]
MEIDLGCGDGSFSVALAKKNPQKTIIAVDILGGRLKKLEKKAITLPNILVFKSESLFFLQIMLPDYSADIIHLLCPDPWPKEKHRYHRILSSEFSGILSRKLKKNGIFHFSSDYEPYIEIAERIFSLNTNFEKIGIPETISGLKTDFEIQWLSQGKNVKHLCWKTK